MALTQSEVAGHNNAASCWVIIHGKAYDMTEFLPDHPGGQAIILKYAGSDATAVFDSVHPIDILDRHLDESKHLGHVDIKTPLKVDPDDVEEIDRKTAISLKPLLSECLNLYDFEAVARRVMDKGAWAYYSSGADDEITVQENHKVYHRIWLRPRVLVNVQHVDISTTFLGTKTSIPIYVTATAHAKLGHPEGEVVLTRASHKHNIIQMIPTLSSCSLDEIVDAKADDQIQWFQLYVNKDRRITKDLVQHAERRGCKALFITVDNPQVGRRERDLRAKQAKLGNANDPPAGAQAIPVGTSNLLDSALSWEDIPWFQSITTMPIILKGVQRVEDVLKAIEYGCQGVVLSNHGGRQLEFARSSVEVLAEAMPILREKGLQDKIEIYIDGGARRATDILKALCLGARGVGVGRPFLYAMSSYGQEGVEHAMQILKNDLEMNMRLLGCHSIDELNPGFLSLRGVSDHAAYHVDGLSTAIYEPLTPVPQREKSRL